MCFLLYTSASRRVLPPQSSTISMASLLILFLLAINHLQTTHGFLLKLTKDPQTHHYTTQLLVGTPQLPVKLIVHLSGQSVWLDCPPSSPSRNFISRGSIQCSMAESGGQKSEKTSTNICRVHQQNPITGETSVGDLIEDIVAVDGMWTVNRFLFSCSPECLLNGVKGVLGLGRSKIGFQSQMVNNFDFSRKFTVCLSSSDGGFITSGDGIVKSSLSYSYTPLISSSTTNGYYINVKSIKINGRRLSVRQPIGNVELSSTVPYTVMKTTLYDVFTKAFVAAATAMNLMNMTTMVSPVAPFGVCFSSPAGTTVVPEIELVLQSELVKWRIQGRNSMVRVSDSVVCLGVINGGMGMRSSLILGGYQLEDRLLELDLGRGMMGFSSSLLSVGGGCSSVRPIASS